MERFLFICLGGAIGTGLRYLTASLAVRWLGVDFPYGTLIVNLSGAAVLGFLTGLALAPEEALLAGTAAVGSYTTFSTWMFETQRLGEDRQVRHLVANLAVSLVAGVALAAAGRWAGAHL